MTKPLVRECFKMRNQTPEKRREPTEKAQKTAEKERKFILNS
jgi:hypothetical protein